MKEHDIVVTTGDIKIVSPQQGKRNATEKVLPAGMVGALIHLHKPIGNRVQLAEVEFPGFRVVTVSLRDLRPEHTCVYCGCTDSKACAGGCSWVITFQFGNAGVCSNCLGPHKPLAALKS